MSIGIDATRTIPCSAKSGMGIDDILEAVVAGFHRQEAMRLVHYGCGQLV
jgi:translation elongation factor EF-4